MKSLTDLKQDFYEFQKLILHSMHTICDPLWNLSFVSGRETRNCTFQRIKSPLYILDLEFHEVSHGDRGKRGSASVLSIFVKISEFFQANKAVDLFHELSHFDQTLQRMRISYLPIQTRETESNFEALYGRGRC